ncbi:MAG: hypothetical protein UU20_C0003G0027 [Parcubacteria group bacterium GW2011_GWE2_40_8]|nr:MAG: hypothetical protein UU20_C0003G0027 [Parcubacteria group bacterium GW2011_GWE2_40_8]
MKKLFTIVIIIGIIGAALVIIKPGKKDILPSLDGGGKCGDGICGPAEKANPNLCPKDCQIQKDGTIPPSTTSSTPKDTTSVSADSPFAIQAPFMSRTEDKGYISDQEAKDLLLDAGAKEVRLVLPELEKYDINNLLTKNNISISSDIAFPVYPKDMEKHKSEVKASAKKYKNNVKAWLVINEAETGWKDTPEKYAEYFIATSKAIKSEAPDALVVMNLAGVSPAGESSSSAGLKFLDTALKNGVGPYFDVLDIHIQGDAANYINMGKIVSDYNNIFKQNGIEKKSVWSTEFGTYDGDPDENSRLPGMKLLYQSEKTGLSVGIKKMFWTTMVEWSHYDKNSSGNCYFCSTGLVNNSRNDDGKSHKKLAYYTYKKMVEVLDGSDWNNIQTIQEKDGIYIYKFTKNNKSIWVAWNDNDGSKQVTISGITSSQVKVTEAIPKYESGKEVTDYSAAFNTETKTVSGGKVTITLKDAPVFVEEK